MQRSHRQQSVYLGAIALGMLLAGGLIYILDRPAMHVYLLPEFLEIRFDLSLGMLGDSFPAFAHVYAFIILTIVCVPQLDNYLIQVCSGWLLIDGLFELAQQDRLALWLVSHIPEGFDGVPVLEACRYYLLNGSYDARDMFAILLGSLAAYFTRVRLAGKNRHEHSE